MRRALLAAFFVVIACALTPALAQDYPSRTVRLVVPFGAGGSADTLARIIGDDLSRKFGQAFIVDDRTGAGGNIGADFVAHAQPDGYTLLVTPGSFALAPAFYAHLSFDPTRDFAPVALIGSIPDLLVVHPELGVATVGELVTLAKSKPGAISYASAGVGSSNHLRTELFKSLAGIDLVHVPYRSNPAAEVDVIAGRTPVFFDLVLTGLPHVRSRELRPLMTTNGSRLAALPDVPTAQELGYGALGSGLWFGVYAPAGTPPAIIETLRAGIGSALADPLILDKLTALGVSVTPGGPAALGALTRDDLAKWRPIIDKAGVKLD